ncbi:MAG: ribosome-binding factor A [Actinomycetota bacterium]
MARRRNPRVDKRVQTALADLIETEVADPRLALITITEADVTPDHEVATVYYSTLDPSVVSRDPRRTGGDRIPDAEEVAAGLAAAKPRLQGMLARRAGLRTTPDLRFEPDPVVAQAARVEQLLRGLDASRDVADDPSAASSDPHEEPTEGPEAGPR